MLGKGTCLSSVDMTRWTASRAAAAILVLAACSPSRSDVTDAGIGDTATSSNDADNDVPLGDSACGDSGRARDVASALTTPDPEDPSCLVPAPQPLACIRVGLVDEIKLFVAPIILGSGKKSLRDGVRLGLQLVDERRFEGSGVVHLHYRLRTA
jgi:hypothetical protein